MSDDDFNPPRLTARRVDYSDADHDFAQRRRPRRKRSTALRISLAAVLILLGGLATFATIFAVASITGYRFSFLFGETRPSVAAEAPSTPSPVTDAATQDIAAAAASPTPPAMVPADNPIGLQAQQWGVAGCLGSIVDISKYLTANTDASWRLARGTLDASQEMFGGTIIARDKTSGLQGVSTLFATPSGTGRCNAGYDLVVYFPEACEQTRTRNPAGFEAKLELGPIAEVYSNASGRGAITLLPAGAAGCVMIRTEFFY